MPLLLRRLLVAWDGLWQGLADWLWGSSESVVTMSDSSSGIDPNGRPSSTNAGSADSESSWGSIQTAGNEIARATVQER